ncbi:collagen binding domain-containing protein [Erysipelothrix sp. HDW6C]|uniref:SpaA isopeptide-forming pilin-related protein n=1 Tax=Erysipelothrix sp. HDW6C TaxID=2714930 RepID=UPI00140758BA|nr:SpaA isopeptide-forming pilin-related protein [Erysipelothrix sp. HDW6C]QIK70385.1 collagen binding domain-containing protein [Erysipelothrix sp. HDW6C]
MNKKITRILGLTLVALFVAVQVFTQQKPVAANTGSMSIDNIAVMKDGVLVDKDVVLENEAPLVVRISVTTTEPAPYELSVSLPSQLIVSNQVSVPLVNDAGETIANYSILNGVVVIDNPSQIGNAILDIPVTYFGDANSVPELIFMVEQTPWVIAYTPFVEPTIETPVVKPIEAEPQVAKPQVVVSPYAVIPTVTPIITSIKIVDKDGNEISPDNPVPTDAEVSILFEWEIPEGFVLSENDTYEFDLPEQFKIYTAISGTLDDYGRFDIDLNGHVVMKFNDLAATGVSEGVSGTMEVHTKLDTEKIEGNTEQVIEFPVGEGIDVPISLVPNEGTDIQKSGELIPYNGKDIQWTIDVNTNKELIHNAVVKDIIAAGGNDALKLIQSSIKVVHLGVNVDGSVIEGAAVDPSEYEIIFDAEGGFSVGFKNDINSAYRITFDTEIVNAENLEGSVTFRNSATLVGDGVSGSTNANVSTQYGKPLAKSVGDEKEGHRLDWTIQYNFNEKHIQKADAVIKDTMQEGFVYDLDTLTLYEIIIDENGNQTQGRKLVSPDDYSVSVAEVNGQEQMTITMANDVTKPIEIKYETYPKPGVIIDENQTVTNKVEAEGMTSTGESGKITQGGITKGKPDVNIRDKVMHWTILLNKDRYEMENLVVTDTFSSSQMEFFESSLKIVDEDGVVLNKGVDYTVTATQLGFTVAFTNTVTKQLTMTYDTGFQFTDENGLPITHYTNNAEISWESENSTPHNSNDGQDVELPTEVNNNGKKTAVYNPLTKEITWTVYANYNQDNGTLEAGATIVDQLLPFMPLKEDSVILFNYTIDDTGKIIDHADDPLEEGTIYKLDIVPADNANGLGEKITITTLLDLVRAKGNIALRFVTTLDGQTVEKEYTNTAIFNDGDKDYPLDGKVTVPNGGNHIAKSGKQNGENVDWTVNINFSQSTIEDAIIRDTPSTNQRVLKDTIKLFGTKVDNKGAVTIDTTKVLVEGTDYTLIFNDDPLTGVQTFEIHFLQTLTSPYVMKYSAVIDEINGNQVSNGIAIEGKNTQIIEGDDDDFIVVQSSTGSGTGNGFRGSIIVTKKDSSGNPLEGAIFELLTADGSVVWRGPATTAADGTIAFEAITSGDYILREIKAPAGYVISEALARGVPIRVNNTASTPETNITTYEAVNEKTKVTLWKTHKTLSNNAVVNVAGATYELFKIDGSRFDPNAPATSLGTYVTDSNGQIIVEMLSGGDYYFIERSVPVGSGLVLNDAKVYFRIDIKANGTGQPVVVKTENYQGRASIYKVNEKNLPIGNVEFRVMKVDPTGDIEVASGIHTNFLGIAHVTDLSPGDYYFEEVASATGYVLTTEKAYFTIDTHAVGLPAVKRIFGFKNYKGALEFKKVDAFNQPLGSTEFTLTDANGIETIIVTEADGTAKVDGLVPGTYTLVETKPLPGYILDPTIHAFTIDAQYEGKQTVTFGTLVNYQGELRFKKVDEFGKPLANAEFTLTDPDGITHIIKTDAQGRGTASQLKPGKYKLVETKAPQGFILDRTVHQFEIADTSTKAVIIDLGTLINRKDIPLVPTVPTNPGEPGLPGAGVGNNVNGLYMVVLGLGIVVLTIRIKKHKNDSQTTH